MRRRAPGFVWSVVLAAAAGCTPITGRQAQDWESGRRIETDAAALAISEELESDAARLPSPQREVLRAAFDLIGVSESELDCSAFVARAWSAAGVALPRTVREQVTFGSNVSRDAPQPGDLVFFAFEARPADHVGLYAGRGQILHVSNAAGCVQLATLADPPFSRAWVAVRRPEVGAARSETGV